MTPQQRHAPLQKIALLFAAAAIVGMGSVTVACSPRSEKPVESTPAPSVSVEPTEKKVRTNVTRPPIIGGGSGGGSGSTTGGCGGTGCAPIDSPMAPGGQAPPGSPWRD
ncbi:MAG: hypothetical protein KIH64_006810 [Mycobacterium sp.]|nr:hypothetical protein [Mycobacterium sp.]